MSTTPPFRTTSSMFHQFLRLRIIPRLSASLFFHIGVLRSGHYICFAHTTATADSGTLRGSAFVPGFASYERTRSIAFFRHVIKLFSKLHPVAYDRSDETGTPTNAGVSLLAREREAPRKVTSIQIGAGHVIQETNKTTFRETGTCSAANLHQDPTSLLSQWVLVN